VPATEDPADAGKSIDELIQLIEDLVQHLVPGNVTVTEKHRSRARYWFTVEIVPESDQTPVDIPAIAVALMEEQREDVANAQPDFQVVAAGYESCGTQVASQWGMDLIGAKQARDIETGQKNVLIALLDTGVVMSGDLSMVDHEDLDKGRFLRGHDVFGETAGLDEDGHGTKVAGVIAATADNGKGLDGLNQGSDIYPCRVMKTSGNSSASDLT